MTEAAITQDPLETSRHEQPDVVVLTGRAVVSRAGGSEPVACSVEAALVWLRDDLDAIVAEVVHELRSGGVADAGAGVLHRVAHRQLHRLLCSMGQSGADTEGTPPGGDVPAALLDACARTAQSVVLRRAAAVACRSGDAATAAATVAGVAERMLAAAALPATAQSNAAEPARAASRGDRAAALAALLDNTRDPAEAARAAVGAGLSLALPVGLVVFPVGGGLAWNGDRGHGAAAARLFARSLPEALSLPPHATPPDATAFVVDADPAGWSRALYVAGEAVRVCAAGAVTVGPVSGVAALRCAARRAGGLAAVAARAAGPRLFAEGELLLDLLLTGVEEEARDAFTAGVLGAVLELPASRAEPLLETLRALGATGGGFAAAAKRLNVHRETVKYRVRRVQELTGYLATDPGHRTHLDIALRLVSLRDGR